MLLLVKTFFVHLTNRRGAMGRKIENIVEMCDSFTKDHQVRVSILAVRIGQQLRLPHDMIENIRTIGLIHDIGKVVMPAEFMARTHDLSPSERLIVQRHPQDGFDLLQGADLSDAIKLSVLQHHERLNGSGYPNKLKGNQILTEAKVVAVADVVDAMTSHRPYNAELGMDDAISELTDNEGTYYDPLVVDACLAVFSGLKRFNTQMSAAAKYP